MNATNSLVFFLGEEAHSDVVPQFREFNLLCSNTEEDEGKKKKKKERG